MRLAVIDSRSFKNKARLAEVLSQYSPSEIVSGAAREKGIEVRIDRF